MERATEDIAEVDKAQTADELARTEDAEGADNLTIGIAIAEQLQKIQTEQTRHRQ